MLFSQIMKGALNCKFESVNHMGLIYLNRVKKLLQVNLIDITVR